MSARNDRPRDPVDADAVRRRQLLLFSAVAAVLLVAVAAWLGGIETQLRELRQEARTLRADNERLRAKLEGDAADARSVIDRQAALIDELRRGLPAPGQAGVGQGNAPDGDPWFQGQAPAGARPDGQARPTMQAPGRMIETFELDGAPQSSLSDPRSGPELVADAVAKPVSAWLPAGAHAEAVVLAGVDASAGVSSQGDPRPVLLRITGPAWTAAEDGAAMQVDVDGCTVTGAAHGDLSSEKVYVRCPACRDLLDAGAAAMHEHHVGVFLAGLVEPLDHRRRVGDVLAAGDGDERPLR